MGKRKQSAPQKAGEDKRKCLTWNMMDNAEANKAPLIEDAVENSVYADVTVTDTNVSNPEKGKVTDLSVAPGKSSSFDEAGPCYRRDSLLDTYELHKENCLFGIPILSELRIKEGSWKCVLAEFEIRFSPFPVFVPLPTDSLPDVTQFTLHVSDQGEKNLLSYEIFEQGERTPSGKRGVKLRRSSSLRDVQFWLVDTDLPLECLEALKCKSFQVVINRFEPRDKCITLKVFGTETVLSRLSCPGEGVRTTKQQNHSLKVLMQHFYGISVPDYDDLPYTKKHDIDELYRVIKERHMAGFGQVLPGIQHPDLLPRLRPYQQQAITWMLEKERHVQVKDSSEDDLHILYKKIVTMDGQTLYFHKYAGVCLLERPCCVPAPPGGILGEEMGLGKTVEVLACMLHNPRETVPLPDPLPVVEDLVEIETNKKKKRKRKRKRISSFSSDSDDDTLIYSDLNNEKVSPDLNSETSNQSDCRDLKRMDQSNHNDLKTAENVSDKKTDCDIDTEGQSGYKTRNITVPGHIKEFKNIFTERPEVHKAEFECLCGATGLEAHRGRRKRKHAVQCTKCHLWQHAECVNYDVKDPYRGEFKCPHCHVASDPVSSGATLIISPFSIAHQWVEEILKHVKKEAINVFMYNGVHKQGFIQPRTLAKQDIVITTYETLRKEIDYVDLPHCNSSEGRKLRYAKRFMAIPSPMTAVEWWRICLDEAQMVECTTTKTAEMALRLSAINRWCVTGTPIQKSVDDLYGLLLFLGVDPYWVHMWWNKLVFTPFCHGFPNAMHDLLTSVLWRTVKNDVLDQINIPKQTDEIHWLTFSPVEEHFYRRQYRDCVRLSMERLSKWTDSNIRLSSLDRHTVSQLLYPLLRLRQACCHPQAVRGEFLPIHKSTMTMEELLESLTKKAKLEAEESHRALVAAMNGEAGLHIINEQFVEAVEKYRDVLRSVEEHKDTLKTDSLQQLHAMYNLHEILMSKPEGVDPTLRDHQLSKQIDELRDKYMAKAVAYAKSTEEALVPLQLDVKQLQREFKDSSEWWLEVIQWAIDRDLDDNLVLKVRDDLLDNRNPQINTLVRSCRSAAGLEYAVNSQLSGMEAAYKAVQKAMKGLEGKPSQDLINKTVECCLRPVDEILKICPFCQSEEIFETYEAKLFSFVEKGIDSHLDHLGYQVNTKRQGTWADSEAEKALKSILSFAKHYRVSDELIENGTTHIKLLEALKKEFKKLRAHWAGIKEHVASFDELDMSTTRLRLRLPDEPVPETPQLNILEKTELSQHKLKLASDRIVAQGELRKKQGQLLYLTNLAKNQTNNKDGTNPEPCPICQQELGKEWSVMQCGHCYCIECIRILVERASFGRRNFSVKCAVCRQSTHQGEISYVMTSRELQPDDVGVKGSHSTKVEAIVRCLLQIQRENPKSKSLVFSTWTDVLSVIATALEENDIKYKALYSAGKFQENLASFRQEEDVTTLLLPVHSGANGLNLIEATNVLLVEPILNPAQELQAIGRVHRIGQTKSTHVHRFLIKHTIEQKMNVLLESMDKHNVLEKSEESGLTIGDLSSLFNQQMEEEDREGVHSLDEEEGSSPRSNTEVPSSSRSDSEVPSSSRSDSEMPSSSSILQDATEPVCCTSSSLQFDSAGNSEAVTAGVNGRSTRSATHLESDGLSEVNLTSSSQDDMTSETTSSSVQFGSSLENDIGIGDRSQAVMSIEGTNFIKQFGLSQRKGTGLPGNSQTGMAIEGTSSNIGHGSSQENDTGLSSIDQLEEMTTEGTNPSIQVGFIQENDIDLTDSSQTKMTNEGTSSSIGCGSSQENDTGLTDCSQTEKTSEGTSSSIGHGSSQGNDSRLPCSSHLDLTGPHCGSNSFSCDPGSRQRNDTGLLGSISGFLSQSTSSSSQVVASWVGDAVLTDCSQTESVSLFGQSSSSNSHIVTNHGDNTKTSKLLDSEDVQEREKGPFCADTELPGTSCGYSETGDAND
ncbi:E3 ubiquitin-protein ligase SHPRH-like isoform X2 [Mercenaria mercenaria]|uniref:E3 ubiquitin-protein ligase SHPRH-like isoform X2 n=1 Tax=Mercenaria mercenaria TaxID=6596 RepID=UPI00234F10C7|nr:E3 ubiquitin-protein ligase SHPRH-like isoform X2 [Mercenaria mercenaria]